jgi:isochorismate synthase
MDPMPPTPSAKLREAAERACADATRRGAAAWLVWRHPLAPARPLPGLATGAASDRFRWELPERDFALAGDGAAAEIEASGPERFRALAERARRVSDATWLADELDAPGLRPAWLGGFGFLDDAPPTGPWRDFPAARFVLPAWLDVRDRDIAWAHRAVRVDPGTLPADALHRLAAPHTLPGPTPRAHRSARLRSEMDEADYLARIRMGLDAVRRGEAEKLVVASELRCHAPGGLDLERVLASLRARHPECRIFAVARGDATFLGATPERLVAVRKGVVRADALAGTAPRGRDAAEDQALARALLESKKEQEEHAVVVRAVREALEPLCEALELDEAPSLRRLHRIQHLHTRAQGTLPHGTRAPVLRVAERLHPTPAVSGAPGEAALAWLRRNEGLDRGWYAGGVGWLDLAGEGELAVALRSAWVRENEARLFAGGGIVADSDPEAELRETRLKLGMAQAALAEGAW